MPSALAPSVQGVTALNFLANFPTHSSPRHWCLGPTRSGFDTRCAGRYCWVMLQLIVRLPVSLAVGQTIVAVPGMLIASAVPFLLPAPACKL